MPTDKKRPADTEQSKLGKQINEIKDFVKELSQEAASFALETRKANYNTIVVDLKWLNGGSTEANFVKENIDSAGVFMNRYKVAYVKNAAVSSWIMCYANFQTYDNKISCSTELLEKFGR